VLGPIVSSNDLVFYSSQTARGQMLIGAEFDRPPSYRTGTTFSYLQACARKATTVLPFLSRLRVLRQWSGVCDVSLDFSPILGLSGVDGFLLSTGWGTWGFKAIPAAGEQLASLIATGVVPDLIAPFGLDRFAREAAMGDPSSAGTR
jgi:sarcosine oxidase subunit beta